MNIKPLGDKVVIKPITEDEKTKSGIIMPDTAEKEEPKKGEVIAVGPGKTLDDGKVLSPEVKPGDKVLFDGFPTKIKVDGNEVTIVSSDNILAILE